MDKQYNWLKKEDYKAICEALSVENARLLTKKIKPKEYYRLAYKEAVRLISLLPDKARARWEKKLDIFIK